MDLGKLGVWYFFDGVTTDVATEAAQRIEALGYGTLWLPETVGKDPLTTASWFLANTKRLNMATGIVNIYNREPGVMLAAQRTLAEQSGGRFALAMGVSHKPLVEGVRGLEYGPPVATMRNYLEKMSASIYNGPAPAETPPTLIAALGPKMLELAKEQTDGAHPYFTSPDHTAMAREILGDGPPGRRAKNHFRNRCAKGGNWPDQWPNYQRLPNYRNNWLRMGLTEQDIDDLSDRFIDATFAWGNADAIKARIQEHIDAGADHVCVQPVNPNGQFGDLHWECLETVAN